MPVPPEYQRARDDFYAFLLDARDTAGLATTHQTFTMVQGVLQAFRRRLETRDAILFANALPPLLRALFVADWDPAEPRLPFADDLTMTQDARSLRPDHNFAPATALRDVATALRRHVDVAALDRALARLPTDATRFWQPNEK